MCCEKYSLAQKVDLLFSTVRNPYEPEQTYSYVSNSIKKNFGVSVSPSHLCGLRHGDQKNPSFKILEAIAKHFNVPIQFFSDGTLSQKQLSRLQLLAKMLATPPAERASYVDTLSPIVKKSTKTRSIAKESSGKLKKSEKETSSMTDRAHTATSSLGYTSSHYSPSSHRSTYPHHNDQHIN